MEVVLRKSSVMLGDSHKEVDAYNGYLRRLVSTLGRMLSWRHSPAAYPHRMHA